MVSHNAQLWSVISQNIATAGSAYEEQCINISCNDSPVKRWVSP